MTNAKEHFDVIALFGILYHVVDHFRLLRQCAELRPKLFLVDSVLMRGNWPFIKMICEHTGSDPNATPQIVGQTIEIKGVPSSVALDRMAETLNTSMVWSDWESLPPQTRAGSQDYFRAPKDKIPRRTRVLRPKGGALRPEVEGGAG